MRGSRFHGGCRDELSDTPVQMPVHMLWGHPCLYETAFVSNFASSVWKQPRMANHTHSLHASHGEASESAAGRLCLPNDAPGPAYRKLSLIDCCVKAAELASGQSPVVMSINIDDSSRCLCHVKGRSRSFMLILDQFQSLRHHP
ncbi:hypothetical protein SRHO_G00293900 [Serrasalmus rhombeus]